MLRRRAWWLISLPLAVAGWLSAHCLAYLLASPGAEHGMHVHAERGHAYLGYTPALIASGLALVVIGLLLCAGEGLRGRRASDPPGRLFALLPPLGFALQEHLERLIESGALPHDLATEPTFLLGLALQVPFAFATLHLARALHALGFRLGDALARALTPGRPLRRAAPALVSAPTSVTLLTPSVLALGHGQRAPPPPLRL